MNPSDFRNATFDYILGTLNGARARVYELLLRHGPCTTLQLAEHSETLSLLTVRPRVTELCQLGLARLAPEQPRGTEGVYQAVLLEDLERSLSRPVAATQLQFRGIEA